MHAFLIALALATSPDTVQSDDLGAYIQAAERGRELCGPYSLFYCMQRRGHEVDLDELVDSIPREERGVRISHLLEAATRIDPESRGVTVRSRDLHALKPPAILVIDDTHCVVFEGIDPQTGDAVIFEPTTRMIGMEKVSFLRSHWSGEAIVFGQWPSRAPWALLSGVMSITALVIGLRVIDHRFASKAITKPITPATAHCACDLSVIIPMYDEEKTVSAVLEKVAATVYSVQIIVVDDGSSDGSAAIVEEWRRLHPDVNLELVAHGKNKGKGAAVRTGLEPACGRVVLIQDADLEYEPSEYSRVVDPILQGQADVVYGSRYLKPSSSLRWTTNRLGVKLLNWMVAVLYGQWITDEATCYKAFRCEILKSLSLTCERFEFCPEVTAKLCRRGFRIHEVPINYSPRTVNEGKKIRVWDGFEAITTLLYWRFAKFPEASPVAEKSAFAGQTKLLPTREVNV